jgi:DNA-binding MarR family transcriptional regulator
MTPPTPSPAPALTGRDIGQAEHAVRALLDQLLDRAGMTYEDWTILFALDAGGPQTGETLARVQADGLKIPVTQASATVAGLRTTGVLAETPGRGAGSEPVLTMSEAGEARFLPIRQQVATITVELYGDLPPSDLEATQRTLAEVTRRANTRLATH